MDSKHEAASAYADAAHSYKKTSTKACIGNLEQALNIFMEIGRLSMAARYCKEIVELYEQEQNLEQAIAYYNKASDLFLGEEVTTSANQCTQKITQFSAQVEQCFANLTEFILYFHYCRSLRFEDKPDYSYLKRLFRELFTREIYQFDYIFDWTMLKYPHVGSSSRGRTTTKLPLNPGISAEKAERTPVKQEVRDRFSGAVESFIRRNGSSSGLHGDHQSRHRSSENVTPSKDALKSLDVAALTVEVPAEDWGDELKS
ncbi:unnamed protein product [Lactuca saligna]|uniref:Non-specific serine/threonine protein kinase n=1 Tax=Lactuca saligna TaxID=75948 RepID=A0AA35YUM1_LACSI|nr:unnamed protein product [Lactuca saligna]